MYGDGCILEMHSVCLQLLSMQCFPLQKLTTTLQLKNWEKTSDGDVMIRFQYADGQHQITASPQEMTGPGWEAAIYGQQGVRDIAYHCRIKMDKECLGPGL